MVYDCLLYGPVIGLDLESHSREKVQFFETRLRIIFLALAWRDEIEIIIWPFSYFETRTRFRFVTLIFRDEIENDFSCSHLARRDRDYYMTILVFRDENEIPFCYSHVSRRDRDFRKSFLVVEREKMKLTLVENSRDREFSLTSATYTLIED